MEEVEDIIQRGLQRPQVIVEGSYRRFPWLLDEVDLIVWIDLPLRITFPRLLRRCCRQLLLGVPGCNGNRETITRLLTPSTSILWKALRYHAHKRTARFRDLLKRRLVRLCSPAEVDEWVARFPTFVL